MKKAKKLVKSKAKKPGSSLPKSTVYRRYAHALTALKRLSAANFKVTPAIKNEVARVIAVQKNAG